jgi:hypothetical protein
VSTALTRLTQVLWNQLGGHINPYNPALQGYFERLHLPPTDPHAIAILAQQLAL